MPLCVYENCSCSCNIAGCACVKLSRLGQWYLSLQLVQLQVCNKRDVLNNLGSWAASEWICYCGWNFNKIQSTFFFASMKSTHSYSNIPLQIGCWNSSLFCRHKSWNTSSMYSFCVIKTNFCWIILVLNENTSCKRRCISIYIWQMYFNLWLTSIIPLAWWNSTFFSKP